MEELVYIGSHVDAVVRFALGTFLIHESINGIVGMKTLDEPVYDLKESFVQRGRIFLCGRHTFMDALFGISFSGATPAKAVFVHFKAEKFSRYSIHIATACHITSFVLSSFANAAIRLEER